MYAELTGESIYMHITINQNTGVANNYSLSLNTLPNNYLFKILFDMRRYASLSKYSTLTGNSKIM